MTSSSPAYRYHADGGLPAAGGVWVFGSNLAGRHGAGAAKVAAQRFGAKYGTGIGASGDSYAIPTKDAQLRTMPIGAIARHVAAFLEYARAHPETPFYVTRVGCGLAGHSDRDMAALFHGAPSNCNFASDWQQYLEPTFEQTPSRPRPR